MRVTLMWLTVVAGGFRFRRDAGQHVAQLTDYHSSLLAQHHPRLAEAGEFQRAAIRISDILPLLAGNVLVRLLHLFHRP